MAKAQNTLADNETTALSLYMAQARKIPLLSAAQEAALARSIQAGGADARAATEQMILANLRLVASIAWKYVRPDVPLEDLVQEGNLGLMHAISKFDPEKGFRLSTYAQWWIHQSVRRYLQENGRLIRLPVRRAEQVAQMNRVIAELSQGGRLPADKEVAARMEVDVDLVRDLAGYAAQPLSLSLPVFDGDSELGATIADEGAENPEDAAVESDFKARLRAALGKLSAREVQVLTWRFGLDGDEPKTLEEVGSIIEVTRERVRQIEAGALKKLARGESGQILRQFLVR